MAKKIIPSIITTFKANSYDFEKDGVSFSFLIAFAGNVFEIGDSLDISQSIDHLYGIGSGSPYALGYLAGTLANLAQIEWAQGEFIEALQISAKYDINTGAPFQIEIQQA
jgi:ATP-dependent protease HslVU (ClpYQ) peptidase subunit